MVLVILDHSLHVEEWNLIFCLSPYKKLNSKDQHKIKDLNIRPDTMSYVSQRHKKVLSVQIPDSTNSKINHMLV